MVARITRGPNSIDASVIDRSRAILGIPAEYEARIAVLTIVITGLIFVTVASLISYTIWRFRRRPGDDVHQEPAQVYGSNQIEIAWTVIPILIVFILAGVTARVVAGVQDPGIPKSALNLRVVGHQWWWEVQYKDFGFTTANEIHMPLMPDAKSATFLDLESADVIHSFWVPQLSGKLDLIPNRRNTMWVDPRQKGVYVGNCAEYCGTQHANMLLRVIVEDPNDFKRWIEDQQRPAVVASEAAAGKAVFESLSGRVLDFGCGAKEGEGCFLPRDFVQLGGHGRP